MITCQLIPTTTKATFYVISSLSLALLLYSFQSNHFSHLCTYFFNKNKIKNLSTYFGKLLIKKIKTIKYFDEYKIFRIYILLSFFIYLFKIKKIKIQLD